MPVSLSPSWPPKWKPQTASETNKTPKPKCTQEKIKKTWHTIRFGKRQTKEGKMQGRQRPRLPIDRVALLETASSTSSRCAPLFTGDWLFKLLGLTSKTHAFLFFSPDFQTDFYNPIFRFLYFYDSHSSACDCKLPPVCQTSIVVNNCLSLQKKNEK